MATITDTPPDKIKQEKNGQHRFYFTRGKNLLQLPLGAKYIVVDEPNFNYPKGRVVLYEIVPGRDIRTWAKVIYYRPLRDEEIAHFRQLVTGQN